MARDDEFADTPYNRAMRGCAFVVGALCLLLFVGAGIHQVQQGNKVGWTLIGLGVVFFGLPLIFGSIPIRGGKVARKHIPEDQPTYLMCWYCGKDIHGRYFVDVIESRSHDGPLYFCPSCRVKFDECRKENPENYWDYDVKESYGGWAE